MVYALDAVLDGVLYSDDVLGNVVDEADGCIEGGCFSGACGSGDKNDTVGLVDKPGHNLAAGLAHTEGFESLAGKVQSKEAQSNPLSQDGGNDSDADVKGGICYDMAKSAVLGGAFFSNVEMSHDLDSADQRGRR